MKDTNMVTKLLLRTKNHKTSPCAGWNCYTFFKEITKHIHLDKKVKKKQAGLGENNSLSNIYV